MIPDNSAAMFDGTVLAAVSGGVNVMWTVRGIVRRGAATTVVKGVTVTNTHADAGAATWAIAAVADTTLGGLSLTTTGTGGYVVLADITLTEIRF